MKELWNDLPWERRADVKASLIIVGILLLAAGAVALVAEVGGIG